MVQYFSSPPAAELQGCHKSESFRMAAARKDWICNSRGLHAFLQQSSVADEGRRQQPTLCDRPCLKTAVPDTVSTIKASSRGLRQSFVTRGECFQSTAIDVSHPQLAQATGQNLRPLFLLLCFNWSEILSEANVRTLKTFEQFMPAWLENREPGSQWVSNSLPATAFPACL